MTDNNGSLKLSQAILEAVANAEDTPVSELSQKLYSAIDPDALDNLFRNTRGSLTFEFAGYLVVVDSDGHVDVQRLP